MSPPCLHCARYAVYCVGVVSLLQIQFRDAINSDYTTNAFKGLLTAVSLVRVNIV